MSREQQQNKEPASPSTIPKVYSKRCANGFNVSAHRAPADQAVQKIKGHERSRSQPKAAGASSPPLLVSSISQSTERAPSLSTTRPQTPSLCPKDVEFPLSPIPIRYKSTIPATPPKRSNDSTIVSPTQFSLPASPPAIKTRSLTSPATSPSPYSPCFTPLTPPQRPQRPPRPSCSLPNLRPTIILSPTLASALPLEDRPSLFHLPSPKTHYKRTQTHSTQSSSSSSEYVTALPSPVFFAPRSWTSHGQYSALRFCASPTCSEKETELQAFRYDWANDSITALPPPCPPPTCPLPPPPPSPKRRDPTVPLYSDEKILISSEDPGGEITVDIEPLRRRPAYYRRHKQTMKMIATLTLIVVLASAIAGGVIWKLQNMCSVNCR